jgi:flagellar hook-length control protein FliK
VQHKPVKMQNAQVQLYPASVQLPQTEELQKAVKRGADDVDVEIVVKDEEVVQELLPVSTIKSESVALNKSGAVLAVSAEEKPRQLAGERTVTEGSAAPVSREQITAQVREKLAEHRFTQDNGQVTIRLNPADLGELKISVRMDDQRLRVEIVAENRTVKDALMENLGSLKEALARQNMEMKQFDVSTGSRQFFNQGFREGRQQEQQLGTTRQTGWLTGRMAETAQAASAKWQPRDNALLDMMM